MGKLMKKVTGLMKKAPEPSGKSAGGSDIYAYEEKEPEGFRPPQEYGKYAERVSDYFEMLFPGRETTVFHEILSDLVHIDVNIMRPSEKGNFYVLYTTGMSDLPMTLPDQVEEKEKYQFAELYAFMPPDWNPGKNGELNSDLPWKDYWVIHMLKYLARFPHEYDTWLGGGHTIPNGPDYEPLTDESGMGGVVLIQTADDLEGCETEDGSYINLLMAVPAYREEIEYKLVHGMSGLDQVFRQNGLPLVIDIHRKNYCAGFTGEDSEEKRIYDQLKRKSDEDAD